MTKVLIIEDDEVVGTGMAQHLGVAGFDSVWVGASEPGGLARLRYERPDVLVLDLMLPGLDGWHLIETARSEGIGTPIVVVSARGSEHDRVHALQLGADDYLVKPFSMKEFVARVHAAARRGPRGVQEKRGDEIVIEELRIDPQAVHAYVDGKNVDLTYTEFRLLHALALDPGRVASRDELLQNVWGRRATHRDRTVDVCVRRLREKIDRRASRHTFIQTRYGVGYAFKPEPKEVDGRSAENAVHADAGGGTDSALPGSPAKSEKPPVTH
jgi:DNA-binding response OmpR family regulator